MSKAKPPVTAESLNELQVVQETACKDLQLELRTMFGCQAFFRSGCVFSLIWKEGRIAIKIPDQNLRAELLGVEGACLWKAGNKTMKEWVLVPLTFHKHIIQLRHWNLIAHALAAK